MTQMQKILDSNFLFVLMGVWLALLAAVLFWPASYWFEVSNVKAGQGRAGEPVVLVVDRTIKHEFIGSWYVTIRKLQEDGVSYYCAATGTNHYKPSAPLPKDLTLNWWTEGKCPELTEGKYIIDTVWSIQPTLPFLPTRHVQAESNIFEVTP